ncbi:chemotaxis protein CheA [Nitrincola iocasae]|uniref:Chemotaxis protein CheA n=1 Tax=Nitrincola iocasae TaxID=2614693 RepID=A0A5J6LJC6_9GAMM|nr:chemotaxis protein CheA [Nitrincola iocasae]QEW08412.1 chemotaxis protein CheA [Nitrincola iocasae]
MNMDEVLQTFIAESRELLQQMEDSLLSLEQSNDDPEIINAIFRAAHTIKGSAGLFGLDHVVAFTHVAESVLDRVRDGELSINDDLSALMLTVCDHIGVLIELIAAGESMDDATAQHGAQLVEQLQSYLVEKEQDKTGEDEKHHVPLAIAEDSNTNSFVRFVDDTAETDNWHISLRFGADVLRNGMDPASFIRYLGTFGRIVRIVTLLDRLPDATAMDPETNYLGFEVAFNSETDKAEIESVFDFVRDDCEIRILPPHSKIIKYQSLIRDLPEEEMRLGEILIRCGTLTQIELDSVLVTQAKDKGQSLRPIGEVLVEEHLVRPAVVEAALEKQKQVKEKRGGDAGLIRVDAAKLDQLINLIGELIIAGAGASLIAEKAGMAELNEANETMTRLVEEVRDSALTLRMVQIGGTFNRFQRVVHDVSKELGKDIRLEISGGETELDKTLIEKIGDPLMHLVRNSMDHGIESAEVRLAKGKPTQGKVRLNACHDAGSIVIEVSDDGAGLDRDRIFTKAVDKGLISADAVLSDKEIYNLIFEPGFSTVDQVSNLSGRGVGMDVVRRNIQALRGSVELDSEPGNGSKVRIRLPLTLAIIDGFLIGVGDASYVVPLDMVVECIELDHAQQDTRSGHYINLRGEVLPYVRLRDQFDINGEPSRRENIVVVNYAGHKAGLVVDRLMGEFQTVIKPLGKVFSVVRGIGGFTILGSGEVALILDVAGLIRQVTSGEERSAGQLATIE